MKPTSDYLARKCNQVNLRGRPVVLWFVQLLISQYDKSISPVVLIDEYIINDAFRSPNKEPECWKEIGLVGAYSEVAPID